MIYRDKTIRTGLIKRKELGLAVGRVKRRNSNN
jgi:hypothetical protein